MHTYVSLCSIMNNSFQYGKICQIFLRDLGENKSVYVLSSEMSELPTKNVQDPRSQDPAF